MNDDRIIAALEKIQAQLDEILTVVRALEGKKLARAAAKRAKLKATQLTDVQIGELKAQFASLYDRWLSGNETTVQAELEQMDADQLRFLADANNLNVTSKTPKAKCIHLIGARFREKRQLTAGLSS